MADIPITAANVLASTKATPYLIGIPAPMQPIAGAAITAGQPVYKGSDDRVYPAKAVVMAAQTSGSLTIGKRYVITTFLAGDDFTNVGAASNATGVIFIATGTTPTTWTHSSVLNEADLVYKVVGIAENTAAAGQPVSVVQEDPVFQFGGTGTIGDVLILSSNLGAIAPVADRASGWFVSDLMVLSSATTASFKINRSDVAKP
jgi:hypothetical protein